jgi:hypothetical protein
MNPWIGWALAAVLFLVGWQAYGWQGALAAFSATVFWLLLQFTRALKVMKNAGSAPVGHIDSAVMFQSRLIPGLTMLQIVTMTRSLGRRVGSEGDVWAWQDPGNVEVVLTFEKGKLARHALVRPPESGTPGAP